MERNDKQERSRTTGNNAAKVKEKYEAIHKRKMKFDCSEETARFITCYRLSLTTTVTKSPFFVSIRRGPAQMLVMAY
jgi:hypothetical protein